MEFDQGTKGLNVFGGSDIQQKGKFQTFWLSGTAHNFPPLVGHPNFPIMKTFRRVLDPLTVMILKRVSEGIFFHINIFTACKFKDKKEVANSSMASNLLKIIHLFQGKKDLRPSET